MRALKVILISLVSCVAGAAVAATGTDDFVAADTFIAACDKAKASLDAAALKPLLTRTQEQKTKAEAQLEKANKDAAAAVEDLSGVALKQTFEIENEIKGLNAQIAQATADRDRLTADMGRAGSGPGFEAAFRERNARIEQIEALQAEVGSIRGMLDTVSTRLAEISQASDLATKANGIIAISSSLGIGRMAAFAGPAARWTAANLAVTTGRATTDAAEKAVDCIGRKIATIEEAKAAEAKFMRDNLIRLGKSLQAKGEELNKAKKAVESVMGRMFSGATDAQINAAADAYWTVSDQFLQIGAEFEAEMNKLAAKGIATEPWMTQLTSAYTEAKKIAAEAKAKSKRR